MMMWNVERCVPDDDVREYCVCVSHTLAERFVSRFLRFLSILTGKGCVCGMSDIERTLYTVQ